MNGTLKASPPLETETNVNECDKRERERKIIHLTIKNCDKKLLGEMHFFFVQDQEVERELFFVFVDCAKVSLRSLRKYLIIFLHKTRNEKKMKKT